MKLFTNLNQKNKTDIKEIRKGEEYTYKMHIIKI